MLQVKLFDVLKPVKGQQEDPLLRVMGRSEDLPNFQEPRLLDVAVLCNETFQFAFDCENHVIAMNL